MPEVTFKMEVNGKPAHAYFVDGREVPSVSYIIKPCVNYNGIRKDVMENAREFGTAVDLACQYADEGDLDEDTVSEKVRPRLNGWRKFVKEFDFKPLIISEPFAHNMHSMWYAGTPDRYGTCKIGNCVVDLKNTSEIEDHHALQLIGYEDFYSDGGKIPVNRIIVQLLDNDYKIHECKDRSDRRMFANLLAVAHWKFARGHR